MKFLSLEEAASRLGVTPGQMNQMRERGEARGFKDGSSWKFNEDDVNRLAGERKSAVEDDDSSGDLIDLPLEISDDSDSADVVLASELSLGESSPSTSSTVIGKEKVPSGESDIELAGSGPSLGGSDVKLVADSGKPGSDVKLVASSDIKLSGSAKGSGKSSGKGSGPMSELNLAGGSGLTLGSGIESDIRLSGSDGGKKGASSSSDALKLSLEDDLVLGDSGLGLEEADENQRTTLLSDDVLKDMSSSDVTLSPGDSGISIGNASDSGLSLEKPLDLMGGSGPVLGLTDDEKTTELSGDDDFLLTPVDDGEGEESTGAGSQVIALDSEGDFGGSSATLLTDAVAPMGAMLDEDAGAGMAAAGMAAAGFGAAGAAMMTSPATVTMGPAARTAPYTIWNVLGLTLCTLSLTLCGMMMFDLMRSMWSWNEPYQVTSSIMEQLIGLVKK